MTVSYTPRKRFAPEEYAKSILEGDRIMLSRAITLIESKLPSDVALAEKVLELILPHTGNSLRVGITGVPGVGKSTFIESFGGLITGMGKKLAVLTIDPSPKVPYWAIRHVWNHLPTILWPTYVLRLPARHWAVSTIKLARQCCCARRPVSRSFL